MYADTAQSRTRGTATGANGFLAGAHGSNGDVRRGDSSRGGGAARSTAGLAARRGSDRAPHYIGTSGVDGIAGGSMRTSGVASGSTSPRVAKAALVDDEALDEIRRYESFSTVDWIQDSARERARAARERAIAAGEQGFPSAAGGTNAADIWGKLGYGRGERPPRWWPAASSLWSRRAWWTWLLVKKAVQAVTDSGVVILVGILIGCNMAVISIATEWASDLKQGYCAAGWWLNQKFCCWEMMDPAGPGGAVVPPAVAKAAAAAATVAAAASNATATATASSGMADAANASASLAARAAWSPWLAGQDAISLIPRADLSGGGASSLGDMSETCSDWVPWSTWTFPAWIIYILFAVTLSGSCAYLVRSFAPYAAGSGISEIKCILAGFIINGFLGAWTFAIKSLTLPLAIASGLSVGKEGPAVHVACCIGNIVARSFRSFDRSQARMREVLTAASAAGVAVAFGSPIGGVLFSLEARACRGDRVEDEAVAIASDAVKRHILSPPLVCPQEMAYNFPATTMWRSFLCALAATWTLSIMNPFRTGKLVLFQVSYDRDWHYFEMVFYIIIGIFGGLYGAFVIKYNLQVQLFRRNHLAAHGVSEAVLLATLTAFVGYWNKFLRIDMTESLEILFRECEGGGDYGGLCQSRQQWQMVNSLLLATVVRVALVILSYGCKVPAGIFVPSMAIGATFGRMVGILVKALYNAYPKAALFSSCEPDVPCITPGTYAFLGAAAALAGVTRITVAVVVIMFELTGALTYILPTMLVVMVTKGVGDWYGKGGIAEQAIKFQGYPFLDKEEHAFGIPVSDVMQRRPDVVIAQGLTLRDLEAKLARGTYKGFPVVRSAEDATLLGYIGKTELRYALAKARHVRGTLSPSTICRFLSAEDEDRRLGIYAGGRGSAGNGSQDAGTTVRGGEVPFTPSLPTFSDEGPNSGRSLRATSKREDEETLIGGTAGDEDDEDEDEARAAAAERFELPKARGLGGHEGEDADEAEQDDVLELGAWVNQTPLCVQPSMQLEVVMDLFKKMGPRVIIVTRYGRLEGLCTVKDLLKHVAAQEKLRSLHAAAALGGDAAIAAQGGAHRQMGSLSSTAEGGLGGGGGDFGGELEEVLSDAWAWLTARLARLAPKASFGGAPAHHAASGSTASSRGAATLLPTAAASLGGAAAASSSSTAYARLAGSDFDEPPHGRGGATSSEPLFDLATARSHTPNTGGAGAPSASTTLGTTTAATAQMSSAEQEAFVLGEAGEEG